MNSVLNDIARLVSDYSGMANKKAWRLESSVSARMKILNLHEISDYIELLLHPVEGLNELDALTETIRVNETGWFRHKKQINDLTHYIFPRFRKTTKIRAWSAGCADGRETYTLALCFLRFPSLRFSVLGSDISKQSVKTASSGVWLKDDAINIPQVERVGFFDCDENGNLLAKENLKQHCSFMVHNLMDSFYPGGFHLILCRNVLIYMNKKTRLSIMKKLIRSLNPEGYLVLGYAEANEIPSDLAIPERLGTSVFWKPASSSMVRNSTPDKKTENRKKTCYVKKLPIAVEKAESDDNAEIKSNILNLRGSFPEERMTQLAEELRNLLTVSPHKAVVKIDEVDFFCKQAAVYMRRAAAQQRAGGGEFVLVATKPGTLHWARRSNLSQWMMIKETDI